MSAAVGRLFFVIGCGTAIFGLLVFASQCAAWFKLGEWTPITVHNVLEEFGLPDPKIETSMLGFQKIIDAILPALLQLPFSMVLVILGGAIGAYADKHFPPVPRRTST